MMNNYEKADIKKLAENINSLIIKCQNENVYLLNLLRRANHQKINRVSNDCNLYSRASGDNPAVNTTANEKVNLHIPDTGKEKERLILLIKKANEDNLKLRESNVKLKQESKLQDQKLRDLKYKIMLQEKNVQKNETQKALINDMKRLISNKRSEIKQLNKNLNDVKMMLVKEQKKIKNLKEHQKCENKPKKWSTSIRDILCKIETLLYQIDMQLCKRKSSHSHNCSQEIESDEMQNLLNRLKVIKSKLKKQQSELQVESSTPANCNQNNQMKSTANHLHSMMTGREHLLHNGGEESTENKSLNSSKNIVIQNPDISKRTANSTPDLKLRRKRTKSF